MENERMTAWVSGRVQGVGFRWFTKWRAQALGLTGTATNLDDGRVEVIAEGPRADLDKLFRALADPDVEGRPGRVDFVTAQFSQARGVTGFKER